MYKGIVAMIAVAGCQSGTIEAEGNNFYENNDAYEIGAIGREYNDRRGEGHDRRRHGRSDRDRYVTLCHVPRGDYSNSVTITVSGRASSIHLRNHRYDYLGDCVHDTGTGTGGTTGTGTGGTTGTGTGGTTGTGTGGTTGTGTGGTTGTGTGGTTGTSTGTAGTGGTGTATGTGTGWITDTGANDTSDTGITPEVWVQGGCNTSSVTPSYVGFFVGLALVFARRKEEV